MIDYRRLLQIYIRQIYDTERVTWIDSRFNPPAGVTEEEWRELAKIEKEVAEEWERGHDAHFQP